MYKNLKLYIFPYINSWKLSKSSPGSDLLFHAILLPSPVNKTTVFEGLLPQVIDNGWGGTYGCAWTRNPFLTWKFVAKTWSISSFNKGSTVSVINQ